MFLDVSGFLMNPDPLPEYLVARINPLDARAYAAASGWERVPHVNGKLALFRYPTSDLDQLLVPTDPTLADYARRMAEVVVCLAERQQRPAFEVLNDLLLPPADILRFRLEGPDTRSGDISLSQGISVLVGARQALLAAACSVVQPQSFHPRLSRTEAEQLLGTCRLAQTERGSFTTVVACPLPPEPSLPLFDGHDEADLEARPGPGRPEPFTRQVTSLLMRSVARIAQSIDADQADSLLRPEAGQPTLSANLCEALAEMGPQEDRTRLSLMANWARTLPTPAENAPPKVVHLRSEYFPTIKRIASDLRPVRKPMVSRFMGLVDSLYGDPDETGRVRGEVQLLLMNQEENIRARVNLEADDYHKAWEAHGEGGYVSLHGTLEMTGERTRRIVGPTKFQLLKDD